MSKIYSLTLGLNLIHQHQLLGSKYVDIPYSTYTLKILNKLYNDAYIIGYNIRQKRKIRVFLKYINEKPLIKQFIFFSKPSIKPHIKVQEFKNIPNIYSNVYLSTSRGILTKKEAGDKNLGGELLFGIITTI